MQNLPMLAYVSLFDLLRIENPVHSNSIHLDKALKWLCLAQDRTSDGGASEGYHLYHGWLPSCPETTGYIVETFFDYFHLTGDEEIKARAIRMAEWLLEIQKSDGSIPDSRLRKSMVFDTGQVIFGFIRGHAETKKDAYREAAFRAGEWLTRVQEKDGSWQRYAVEETPHTYYTRVAWSLANLYSITRVDKFLNACIKNIRWAVAQQEENGWFNCASFNLRNHAHPYTHTIAYTIRGILESGLCLNQKEFIEAAIKSMDNLIKNMPSNGGVFGSYDRYWKGDKKFSCLTGNAQLAIIFFRLYEATSNRKYFEAAKQLTHYLKSKQETRLKNKNIHGAISGSYPIWGKYIHFAYPNWASKFFADALMLEAKHIAEANG